MMMITITDILVGDLLEGDHPGILGIMGEDGTLEDLEEVMDFLEEDHQMEDPWEVDHQEDCLEDIKIILETQDNLRTMDLNLKEN